MRSIALELAACLMTNCASPQSAAALHFVRSHISLDDIAYIDTADYRAAYLNYDWSLNEQP